jgi:hypothetical protein
MPSPFPGMDPFLEHPDFFPDLHGSLHVYVREALQAVLPEAYYAVINERLWVETSTRYVEPDSDILHSGREEVDDSGGVALATRKRTARTRTTPIVVEVEHDERHEPFVEIRTRRSDGGERIVTTIEVLSVSNKTPGEKGQELYLAKQREMLGSDAHLIEIDLLRGGTHTTPLTRKTIERKAGRFDYHVSVHCFDQPTKFFVYPWLLQDTLPEIAVPLLPRDGDVALDLQKVFDRCYDAGPYRRRVTYDPKLIVPPLSEEQMKWVTERLQSAK